jgi:uncharacterized protein YdeI (YjbR/CyaY-like superfamily)
MYELPATKLIMEKPELYFPRDVEWREWLEIYHESTPQGVHLVFYKLETGLATMRWEEAVKVALCFGWIDGVVKSLGNGKRIQYFCPRRPKSGWSALNKQYLEELDTMGLLHSSGRARIEMAKRDGSWTKLDAIERLEVPAELMTAFAHNELAFSNFQAFSRGYRKSYIRWVHEAVRPETRARRVAMVISLCERNIKSR